MGGSGSESKTIETYPFAVTLNLHARFMPMDRGVFEDVLDETLRLHELGEVSGGGTLLSDSGEIEECDIELCLRDGSPELISMIGGLINAMGVPKGSRLLWDGEDGEPGELLVGQQEGLALYLNGTDLPDEVYQNCDANVMIDHLVRLMDGIGSYYSHWVGSTETALYFYGTSYEGMLAAIRDFLDEYPLCQGCRVVQIA